MGAPITDKIRKLHDPEQTVRSGPGHAGFYIDSDGNLMVNINETDGPQQVADITGEVLAVARRAAVADFAIYEDSSPAVYLDAANGKLFIGAYRDLDSGDMIATTSVAFRLTVIEDGGDPAFSISTYGGLTPGASFDEDADVTQTFSMAPGVAYLDGTIMGTGENRVAITAGAAAGNITVPTNGAGFTPDFTQGDTLMSVIAFTAGVPADLTGEFAPVGTAGNEQKINNTGGTNTTGKTLMITWKDSSF